MTETDDLCLTQAWDRIFALVVELCCLVSLRLLMGREALQTAGQLADLAERLMRRWLFLAACQSAPFVLPPITIPIPGAYFGAFEGYASVPLFRLTDPVSAVFADEDTDTLDGEAGVIVEPPMDNAETQAGAVTDGLSALRWRVHALSDVILNQDKHVQRMRRVLAELEALPGGDLLLSPVSTIVGASAARPETLALLNDLHAGAQTGLAARAPPCLTLGYEDKPRLPG